MIYADDTVLFTASKDVSSIENNLNTDLSSLQSWLSKNELLINLNKGKTDSMLFGSGKHVSKLQDQTIDALINNIGISKKKVIQISWHYYRSNLEFPRKFSKFIQKSIC